MIGLLFGLLHIGCSTAKGISDYHEEYESKRRAIKNGRDFYTDRNNNTVHVKDDQPYFVKRNEVGDVVEVNPYTGKTIRNISNENRIIQRNAKAHLIKNAKDNNERFVIYDRNIGGKPHNPYLIANITGDANPKICGVIWSDTNNGRLYVRRVIKPAYPSYIDDDKDKLFNYSAVVNVDLSNGMISPEIVEWKFTGLLKSNDTGVSENEVKQVMDKIHYFNTRDVFGKFINRFGDPWLNGYKFYEAYKFWYGFDASTVYKMQAASDAVRG